MVNFFKNLFGGRNHQDEQMQMQMQQMQMQMYMQDQAMMMQQQQHMFGMQPQQLQYPGQEQQYQQFPGQQPQQQFIQQPGQPAPLLNHNLQIPPQQQAEMQRGGGYVALGPDGNPMIWYPNGFPGAAPAAAAAAPQVQHLQPPAHLQQPQVYAPPPQQYSQHSQRSVHAVAPQQPPAPQFYTPAGIAPNSITQQQIQRVGPHETLIRTQVAAPPQAAPAHPPKPTKFITIKPDGTRITTTVTEGHHSNSTNAAPAAAAAVPQSPRSFRNSASIPQLVSAPHPDIAGALPGRGPASYPQPQHPHHHVPLDPAALQQQHPQHVAPNKAVYDVNAAVTYAAAANANAAISPSSSATPSRNVSPGDGVVAHQFAQFNQSPPTVLRA